jgi:hypothetical protein
MRGLALDPGERVGWCTFHVDKPRNEPATLHIDEYGIARWKQMALGHRIPPLKGAALRNARPPALKQHERSAQWWLPQFDFVIYENWLLTSDRDKLRGMIGSDLPWVQYIGVVRTECWVSDGQIQIVEHLPKRKTDGLLALENARPDYRAPADIIAAAPAKHDDAHYADAVMHTVAWFHKEYA